MSILIRPFGSFFFKYMKVHDQGSLTFGSPCIMWQAYSGPRIQLEANDPRKLEGSSNLSAKGVQKTHPKGIRWCIHQCPQLLAT